MVGSGCNGAEACGILCACRLFKYQCTTKLKSASKGTSNLNETRLREVKWVIYNFRGRGGCAVEGGHLSSSLRYPFDSNIEGWLKDSHPIPGEYRSGRPVPVPRLFKMLARANPRLSTVNGLLSLTLASS